jgi:hypothetical protein
MEASKITFSQHTKAALNARPMSKAAKAKLRRERVKDFIRSQPAGTIIKQTDLAIAAGYDKSQGHGWAFINRMVKNKHIDKDTSEGVSKPSWTVRGDAKIKPPLKAELPKDMPEVADKTPESVAAKIAKQLPKFDMHLTEIDQLKEVSAGMVTQQAKEFAWTYNSDSLRDFIKWLDRK